MKLDRVRWPEWLIGAGGVLLLVSLLALPWYAHSVDGWHGLHHARWLVVITAASGLAMLTLQATMRRPALPVIAAGLAMVLGGASALWLVYRVLISPPGGDRLLGGFVGLAGACAMAYGGWRSLRLEGVAERDAPRDIPTIDTAV